MADLLDLAAETPRLVLRAEAAGDLATWLEWINTPAVTAHLGGVRTEAQVAESFAAMRVRDAASPGYWFVARKSDGVLLGKCGVSAIETATAPDALRGALQVGWTLRADCWGQGYAAEAVTALLGLAFERHRLARLYAQTSHSNVRSWRLMERLGMTRRAALDYVDPDYPPQDNPTMVWELARADWLARHG